MSKNHSHLSCFTMEFWTRHLWIHSAMGVEVVETLVLNVELMVHNSFAIFVGWVFDLCIIHVTWEDLRKFTMKGLSNQTWITLTVDILDLTPIPLYLKLLFSC